MTSEVAVMNQFALVLAADSATTVSYRVRGKNEVRYFKGANKLFQLSESQPVGLMIYGSATLESMPWEIIVKEFRATLGGRSANTLSEYSATFFDFVRNHASLFPTDAKAASYKMLAATEAWTALRDARTENSDANGVFDLIAALNESLVKISDAPVSEPFTTADIDIALTELVGSLQQEILRDTESFDIDDEAAALVLAKIGIQRLYKNFRMILPLTGVVIGGFGTKDIFPSFEVFSCFGFLGNQFLYERNDPMCRTISRSVTAAIEPFATNSMINTFRMGIGPDVFNSVLVATRSALAKFAEDLRQVLTPETPLPDISELIENAIDNGRSEWFDETLQTHYRPLQQVVGSLPVGEMAALAQSLVELQSLKERVTSPTESVGGPIDVAAISKHDGFVWIRRKHYFSAELNPRFFARRVPQNSSQSDEK